MSGLKLYYYLLTTYREVSPDGAYPTKKTKPQK